MEIKINGTPKEIAELGSDLYGRATLDLRRDLNELAKEVARGVRANKTQSQNSDKVDFTAAQKAITNASKKVREEKSTPKYKTREIHIFCGNKTDSDLQNQQVKEITFEDVKRNFQKMLELIKTMENSEMPSPFRKENT